MERLIAITGATGFVGQHVVAALKGHRLRLLVRAPSAFSSLSSSPQRIKHEIVKGDLQDLGALGRLCAGVDTVIHLAGAVSAIDQADFIASNEGGSRAVGEAAAAAGVRHFIFVSSLAARAPQLSDYAASKHAGEMALLALKDRFKLTILRPPAVYGPYDRVSLPLFKMLLKPIVAIAGRKDARFSLIHVTDLARFITMVLEEPREGLFEIDDGAKGGYGWAQLLAVVAQEKGYKAPYFFIPRIILQPIVQLLYRIAQWRQKPLFLNPGKIAELYHSDWVVAGEALPLTNPIMFAQGFAETLNWYRNQGWL